MKTYSFAESRRATPFNWHEYLKRDPFFIDTYEYEEACSLASSWITCACGNQCNEIPRGDTDGEPLDQVLFELGIMFFKQVRELQHEDALETLRLIEIRSGGLIAEINARKGTSLVNESIQSDHPSGLSGEHDVVLDAIEENLRGD